MVTKYKTRFVTMCVTANDQTQAHLIQATSLLMQGLLGDHSEAHMMLKYCQNRFSTVHDTTIFQQPTKAQPTKAHAELIVIPDD